MLQDKVTELATELEVPGVAVGVVHGGQEHYAYAGITSVDNPLPVDETTLFQFGSTGKTYTATAIMRLVEEGKVDLDAPVRTYVPELRLKDEDVAAKVTVLQLLNHTAGWEGDLMEDMGNGDDALAKYVARMADLEQVSPLGATVSYNNASLSLAGRVLENVTGTTYEQAIADLLLKPLGMADTLFFPSDIMTRRFAVGHNRHEDGTITVARPWAMPRGNAPATSSRGRHSTSVSTAIACSARKICSRCRSRPLTWRAAHWGTRSGSRGCCRRSAEHARSRMGARRTASTRASRWCPTAASV